METTNIENAQTLEEVIDMMLDAMVEKAEMVQVQDIPVQQKLIGVMMCFRPDESEADPDQIR